MSFFLLAFTLWFLIPLLIGWSLTTIASIEFATIGGLLVWIVLPLLIQCYVADRTLHPHWHIPGKQPKSNATVLRETLAVESHAGELAAKSEADEQLFESALESEDEVGKLGLIVGSAVEYYAGRITNPRVDFGLPFRHVTIHCRDAWRRRSNSNGQSDKHPSADGNKRKMSDPPTNRSNSAESQLLPKESSHPHSTQYSLRGWYVPADRARTLIVLVHGAGRDRRTFMRHVPIFHAGGYSSLLIDCREHGTSSQQGAGVGFTTREAFDVIHAAKYGREKLGYEKIVVCGTSMGAASSIIAAVLADELELVDEPASSSRNNYTTSDSTPVPSSPVSRSYRNSTTRLGDRPEEDEVEPFMDESPRVNDSHPTTPSSTPHSSTTSTPHLIDGVIAENAFISRESCVSDIFGRLLGRVPSWLAPLRLAKRVLITGTVLVLRWRLGLFSLTRPTEWRRNWVRAQDSTEHALTKFGTYKPQHPTTPSTAIRPLPSLNALTPDSPLYGLSFNDYNAIDLVDRISPRPLLLLHGLADEIIQPIHSQLLYAKARDPKKLWLVADAKHTALLNADPEGWKQTVLTFLAQHGL